MTSQQALCTLFAGQNLEIHIFHNFVLFFVSFWGKTRQIYNLFQILWNMKWEFFKVLASVKLSTSIWEKHFFMFFWFLSHFYLFFVAKWGKKVENLQKMWKTGLQPGNEVQGTHCLTKVAPSLSHSPLPVPPFFGGACIVTSRRCCLAWTSDLKNPTLYYSPSLHHAVVGTHLFKTLSESAFGFPLIGF